MPDRASRASKQMTKTVQILIIIIGIAAAKLIWLRPAYASDERTEATPSLTSKASLSLPSLRDALRKVRTTWVPMADERAAPSVADLRHSGLIPEDGDLRGFAGTPQGHLPAWALGTDEAKRGPALKARPAANQGRLGLPASFDWRNRDGQSFLSPIALKQGACGSCVSFAIIAALEAELNIACHETSRSFELSRQEFFSCGGGTCDAGWKLSLATDYLAATGVPDAACMPYGGESGHDVACSTACSDVSRRRLTGVTLGKPTNGAIDVVAIKGAILGGPVIANMLLYEDLTFYQRGVYRHVTGERLGSHAIVLVGWSDVDQAWIARNSWGEDWGEGGYFKVAWDDDTLPGRYTWSLDVSEAVDAGVCNSFAR